MPNLGLLTGTARRTYGGFPSLPLTNLIAERSITEPTQFSLVSRPRLQKYLSSQWIGSEEIRALYYADGVLDGEKVGIVGQSPADFYVGTEGDTVGTITGSDVPSIAGNSVGIIATCGGAVKFWDGTTYRTVTMPGGEDVVKVLDQGQRFIFICKGTHKYYWTAPGSNMLSAGNITVDSLNFASAESEPDALLDGVVWSDHLVLAGLDTIELHAVTLNDAAPWAPSIGSTIPRGVANTGAMTVFNGSFAWVSADRSVWLYGANDKISNAGIEEFMRGWDVIRADRFFFEGREFLHLWGDDGSGDLVYDAATGEWTEFETDDGPFEGGPAINIGSLYPVFGGKTTGRLLGMATDAVLPGGGYSETTITYRFRCGVPMDAGQITLNNVLLRCQTFSSGSATATLTFSRDKGASWSSGRVVNLNEGIRHKIEWRSLGMFDQPGPLLDIEINGATEFSVSGAMFNEPVQGRSR